jgi:hypothetical protein
MENGLLIYGLISFSVIELIEVIRMVFGPLNQSICWFQMFWRNGPVQGAILELDAIIIFRVIKIYQTHNLLYMLSPTLYIRGYRIF